MFKIRSRLVAVCCKNSFINGKWHLLGIFLFIKKNASVSLIETENNKDDVITCIFKKIVVGLYKSMGMSQTIFYNNYTRSSLSSLLPIFKVKHRINH